MLRFVSRALLTLPVVALMSCGNDCRSVDDCVAPKVCYKGVCQSPVSPEFTCHADDDCSKAAADGTHPLTCVVGRCIFNLTSTSSSAPDAGAPD
ncbi:MAG: hypothetical protein U1E65_08165 [Myxococcota bacterium]